MKWSTVTYLNTVNHHPERITKTDKDFPKKLDFKDIKFPVKIRDTHKIEKKEFHGISVFGYENKNHPIYVSKRYSEKKYIDLLLTGKEEKDIIFLSKILTLSCMIIHYIMKKKTFFSLLFTSF